MPIQKTRREGRNLIGGAWEDGNGRETEPVYDLATGGHSRDPLSTRDDVDRAVEAAEVAFEEWSKTPVVRRVQVLFRYKMLLEEHFEELRDLVTLENGKDAKDAGGEVRRGIEVVEFACGMPTLLMGESVRDVARGIDNDSYRMPDIPSKILARKVPGSLRARDATLDREPPRWTIYRSGRVGWLHVASGGEELYSLPAVRHKGAL